MIWIHDDDYNKIFGAMIINMGLIGVRVTAVDGDLTKWRTVTMAAWMGGIMSWGCHLAVGVIRLIIVYNRFNITREYRYFCVGVDSLYRGHGFLDPPLPLSWLSFACTSFTHFVAITQTMAKSTAIVTFCLSHANDHSFSVPAIQQFLGDFLVSFGLTSGGPGGGGPGGGGPGGPGPRGGPGGPPIPGRPMGPPGPPGPSPIEPGGGPLPGGGGPQPPMGPKPGSSMAM